MPQAAKLSTYNFVLADLRGRKVHCYIQSRHKILLNPQLRHIERVPYILRMHQQVNLAIHRNRQFSGNDVVLRILLARGIETEEVRIRFADLFGMKRSECSIRSRIAEI